MGSRTILVGVLIAHLFLSACGQEDTPAPEGSPRADDVTASPEPSPPESPPGSTTPAPTVTTPSGPTSLPIQPAKKWEDVVRELSEDVGITDLNSPEIEVFSARMTGRWRSHGVLIAHYNDPVHGAPGRQVDTLALGDKEAPVISTRSGPAFVLLTCQDDRWFELAVLDTPTHQVQSQTRLELTRQLATDLVAAADCRL